MTSLSDLILDGIFFSVPELKILSGAYVVVKPGRVCGLIGLNGAGKSTVLKAAAGQIEADSGIVRIGDIRIPPSERLRRFDHLSYLPQSTMLPKGARVYKLLKWFDREDLVDNPIIKRLRRSKVYELSGGERRYLEFQLIIGLNRPFVLLDEPFTGVEPIIIEQLSLEIRDLADRGVGVLLTDHYVNYVLPIIDDGYAVMNKQCVPLPGRDFRRELVDIGYLR